MAVSLDLPWAQVQGLWGPVACRAHYRVDQVLGVSPKQYRVHCPEFEKYPERDINKDSKPKARVLESHP